jgi:hypothetical protein
VTAAAIHCGCMLYLPSHLLYSFVIYPTAMLHYGLFAEPCCCASLGCLYRSGSSNRAGATLDALGTRVNFNQVLLFTSRRIRRALQHVQEICAIWATKTSSYYWQVKRRRPSYIVSNPDVSCITRASHIRPTHHPCPTSQASRRYSSPSRLPASQAPKEGYRSATPSLAHILSVNVIRQHLHHA